MKYYNQLIKHDPENNKHGDCLRTCVACMFDLKPVNVPNFSSGLDMWLDLKHWLKSVNYSMVVLPVNDKDQIFEFMIKQNQGIIYIMLGDSHAVVCCNDKEIHNPAWIKTSIKKPTHIIMFIQKRFIL